MSVYLDKHPWEKAATIIADVKGEPEEREVLLGHLDDLNAYHTELMDRVSFVGDEIQLVRAALQKNS